MTLIRHSYLTQKIVGMYKKILSQFSVYSEQLFLFLFVCLFVCLFSIYKIGDSMDTCKSLNINIGAAMKNLEMLKFIPDHLKTKNMCKYPTKKLP